MANPNQYIYRPLVSPTNNGTKIVSSKTPDVTMDKRGTEVIYRPSISPTNNETKVVTPKKPDVVIVENPKVTQREIVDYWAANREEGKLQAGCILSSEANIYLPIKNGTAEDAMYSVFSFQIFDFLTNSILTSDEDFVLYDYPIFEEEYSSSQLNPFLFFSLREFVLPGDLYDYDTWHVGLLSQRAMDKIADAVGGKSWLIDALIDTDGLVFYKPSDFMWYEIGKWDDILKQAKQKQRRPILAAAAATIINIL